MKELVMTQYKDNSPRKRYRLLASLLAIILMLGCMVIPDTQAQASSLSVGVSASTVKIGDTVTVSITVPAGVSATVNVTYPSGTFSFSSASDTASANGGTVSMTIGSYGSSNTKTTGTMKFKAKAAGSATFSASAPIAGNQDGDRVPISGASASVRVKNESNEQDDNSNTDTSTGDGAENDNKKKSADNSLASLTLSDGKLSPAFQYNVTSYTAEVANDVTSVVVSAKTSNANATVESVKGGENLAVGSNKIQIVVKAENGVTATYTINVTRKEASAADDENTPDEENPADADAPQEQCFEVDGVKLYPSGDGDETQIPEGFALSEITLWEQAYPYWVNEQIGTDLGLIYLVDENKENGAWYRISTDDPYNAQPFVCFKSEFGYIIATPEKLKEAAPEGYSAETINIDGKGIVDAYTSADDADTCLIYAVNQDGTYGWYRYDQKDRTYMRYVAQTKEAQVTEPSTEQPTSKLTELESQNRLLFYAFIVVVAILLLAIVILVVKRRHDDAYDEEDEEDEDDDMYENDEEDDSDDVHDEDASDDAKNAEDELDLSDERAGASKRYDRSAFLIPDAPESEEEPEETGEAEAVADEPEEAADTDQQKKDDAPVSVNTLDLEAVLAQAVEETMDEKPVSEAEDEKNVHKPTGKHKKSYREELREAMGDISLDEENEDDQVEDSVNDEDDFDDEEVKPKKERRGFFGRKKKKENDEDDDIEFLDL